MAPPLPEAQPTPLMTLTLVEPYRIEHKGLRVGEREMPLWFDFQVTRDFGTGFLCDPVMGSFNFGEIKKTGDLRFLYQYTIKAAIPLSLNLRMTISGPEQKSISQYMHSVSTWGSHGFCSGRICSSFKTQDAVTIPANFSSFPSSG